MSTIPSPRPGSSRRITVVRLLDHLAMGGVQKSVAAQLARHDRGRFRLLVVTLKSQPALPAFLDVPELASSRLVAVRHFRDNAGIAALARLLRQERADILHCHSYFPNTVGRQAALLAGVPVAIAHYHSTYGHRRDSSMAAWERVLFPFTSRALMVSVSAQRAWANMTGLPEERTQVVWNLLDLESLRAAAARPSVPVDRALAQCRPGWPMICAVGRLVPLKRMGDIIEAVGILRSRGRAVRLMIAGDGPERVSLQERIGRLGLADRVQLLGTLEDPAPLLARAAALALASDVEGFPRCNLEAMACGAPVITTPAGGAAEVDPRAEFLWVVPHRNPAALAGAVCEVLDHPQETAARIRRAAQAVRQFDSPEWVQRLEAIYSEEIRKAWLARNPPWGYGGKLAKARLLVERLRWRLLRAKDKGQRTKN